MRKFVTTTVSIGILVPGFLFAENIESYVHRMIEHAQQGGGTVIIENHSSVSTGGQVAGAGESIVTDGDVSASSHTETRINAGGSGGEVYVKTKTTTNGETKTDEYSKKVEPGEPIRVNVSAGATNEKVETSTEIQGEVMEGSSSTEDRADTTAGASVVARFEAAIDAVPSFVKKVIKFLKFW